ncbi:site-specific integrase [Conexibacter sp. S30A1]|uniref:tyrosine-type recombinase/integrase n=1 Tax=Conexibacter sp. S30A1 TaxID=2937800 RepID=UPI00200DE42A|nr:site-specific integrase [Conexibacter sp. S30A1]
MPREATGQVVVKDRKGGKVYALRFRANGERQYLTLGTDAEGWNDLRAAEALADELAKVRAGVWRPVRAEPEHVEAQAPDPTFHVFASQWFEAKRRELDESTQTDYGWQLSSHLLPFFAEHRLSEITVAEVDRYRAAKVRESEARAEALRQWRARLDVETDRAKLRELRRQRPPKPLSAASINKTLTRLGQILDQADEYGMIQRNPLRVNPRNRKLRAPKPPAVWLDRAEQIESLLDAAGELDLAARPDRRHVPRRAMLSVLVFGGLRMGELLALRWRDIDLAAGRLYVGEAKTDAGVRHVELLPALREALTTYKAGCMNTGPDDLVFATTNRRKFSRDGFRQRVFARAVEVANERREAAGLPPLPEGLSPHKLRHTCCSLLFVCGYELPRVMRTLGHADSAVTLRIYAHVMSADEGERERLRALVGAVPAPVDWAPLGTSGAQTALRGDSGAV